MIRLNNLNKAFSSIYSEIHFLAFLAAAAAAAAFALASSHSCLAAPKSLLIGAKFLSVKEVLFSYPHAHYLSTYGPIFGSSPFFHVSNRFIILSGVRS